MVPLSSQEHADLAQDVSLLIRNRLAKSLLQQVLSICVSGIMSNTQEAPNVPEPWQYSVCSEVKAENCELHSSLELCPNDGTETNIILSKTISGKKSW